MRRHRTALAPALALALGLAAILACGASDDASSPIAADGGASETGVTDRGDARAETSAPPPPIACADPAALTAFPADDAYAPFVRALSPPKYQHGRCELVALIVDAALELQRVAPEKLPFGVADLSQANGAIPGTDVGAARHPAPSHTRGFSVDITYLRLNGKTLEDSPACPSKTRELCEGPHDVDVIPTARVMAHMARTKRVVQIIVDPVMTTDLGRALDDLASAGMDGASHARKVLTSGVPFHADHFHVSVSRACFDGRDNDGDGKMDLDDPDCADALDDDEGR